MKSFMEYEFVYPSIILLVICAIILMRDNRKTKVALKESYARNADLAEQLSRSQKEAEDLQERYEEMLTAESYYDEATNVDFQRQFKK